MSFVLREKKKDLFFGGFARFSSLFFFLFLFPFFVIPVFCFFNCSTYNIIFEHTQRTVGIFIVLIPTALAYAALMVLILALVPARVRGSSPARPVCLEVYLPQKSSAATAR